MKQQLDVALSSVEIPGYALSNVLNGGPLRTSVASPREDPYWPSSASVPLHSGRVLFAEDNDDLREIMTIFLAHMGYSVTACSDAEFASEAFRCDALIDILMTDLEMPGRSGLELARELTALRPSLPVMIVSGAFITPEMFVEMKARNWKYLAKPCGLPMVLNVLQSLHGEQSPSRAT